MDKYIATIDKRLEELLARCHEPKLREVMTYAVLGPGKRLRPQLLLASCEGVSGGYSDAALDFACAIEMIHAYSLVHDDLPAMDNDDFRRGRPTCHKAFTEGLAVLAGDGLLSLAIEVMVQYLPNRHAVNALTSIVKAAGVGGMIAGQMSDILNEGKPISPETLAGIHRRKTGALITACFEAGGIFASAEEPMFEKMVKLGNVLGLAFQIKDDILDVTSTEKDLGKPIGSDAKNQKNTYVSVHGIDTAEAEYKRLCQETQGILDSLPVKTGALHELVTATLSRTK
ncbi:MAG: polyprenyl synthetase family protein [Defluviitaleaceae bacterium]|nr:polyprenyl synthetase family protein [Defluviitaleaceae bacterium]